MPSAVSSSIYAQTLVADKVLDMVSTIVTLQMMLDKN